MSSQKAAKSAKEFRAGQAMTTQSDEHKGGVQQSLQSGRPAATEHLIGAIKGLARRLARIERGAKDGRTVELEELVFRGRGRRLTLTREQKAWVAAELTKQGRLFP